jgi:hypothetical protein
MRGLFDGLSVLKLFGSIIIIILAIYGFHRFQINAGDETDSDNVDGIGESSRKRRD